MPGPLACTPKKGAPKKVTGAGKTLVSREGCR